MISLPQFHKSHPPDNCGACTACCVIPSVPELRKPFYARCENLAIAPAQGCAIYDDRPDRCRKYRCAWHLSILGDRVDRRPDQCGVLFQYEPDDAGKWSLCMYEFVPGAADTDKARYLRDIILKSKLMAHLPMALPAVRVIPYGADLKADFKPAEVYGGGKGSDAFFRTDGSALRYVGNVRQILEPTPKAE